MAAAMWLSFREGVTAEAEGGDVIVRSAGSRLLLRQPAPAVRDALQRLAAPGDEDERLADSVLHEDGPTALAGWYHHVGRLSRCGLVEHSVRQNGTALATLTALTPTFVPAETAAVADRRFVLSRFACLRRSGTTLVLESPRSLARVALSDPRSAAAVAAMASPATVTELINRGPGLDVDAAGALLTLLAQAGLIEPVAADGSTDEDRSPALQCWEYHDLLFHSRSRMGRFDAASGATFRFAGKRPPPPALRPAAAEGIALFRPDLARLKREDPPLARVQEERRSIREYDPAHPLTARQLGEFLYRVARVRDRREMEVASPAGPLRMEIAGRPYPAGGALYEIEFHVAVNTCAGLEPGLYRHDPAGHRLERIAGRTAEVARLLAGAAASTAIPPERLQVLIILASRFARVAWKYESIAYALMLKHVGVVIQTMYLAATAMGLSPCAAGAGDADLFARAAGLDYFETGSVGEFLLGGRPGSVDQRG